MRGPDWAGEWDMPLAPAVNTLTGTAPPVGWLPGQFKVMGWAGGTTNLASQLYMPYTTGKGMWYRTIHVHTQTGATAWSPWVNLADVTDTLIGATPNILLVQDFTRRRGPVNTNGKGAVALRFDHGLGNFRDKILPLLRARGLKASLALNSRSWGLAENGGVTAAEVDGWVSEGVVEIWNHGAHHSDAVTRAELEDTIVTGLAELRAQLPSAQIDGWVVPGVGGTNYNGFNGGGNTGVFTSTEAGRLILAHHAVATGAIPGTVHRVLDGTVRQGMSHYTLDAVTGTAAQYQINLAATNVTGLQLLLHPSAVDQPDKVTTAKITEILDHIVAKRDAGELVVLSPYQLMLADAQSVTPANLVERGVVTRDRLVINALDYGVKGDGVADDTAALNTVAAYAYAKKARLLIPAGTYKTTGTVTFPWDLDADQAEIRYTGTGTAVIIGSDPGGVTARRAFRAPRVVKANRVTGWDSGSVGLLLRNLNTCEVYVPFVQDFERNLVCHGEGAGFAYTTVRLGALWEGRGNLDLTCNSTGYVNQNLFLGGRLQKAAQKGATADDPEAFQVRMVSTDDQLLGPNNNTFVGTSFESVNVQLHSVQLSGTYNQFLNCRWEYGPHRVLYKSGAKWNKISGGYNSWNIEEVFEGGALGGELEDVEGAYSSSSGVTTGQAIPSGAWTTVTAWRTPTGRRAPFNPETGTWRPRSGRWLIGGVISFVPGFTGRRGARIMVGGTVADLCELPAPTSSGQRVSLTLSTPIRLDGTQAVSVEAYQTSGADLALETSAGYCKVWMEYLGK
ncbi:glycosyl hydrolase family 28-related protein [Kocuria sp. CPCC 205297]|uniref:glycosyl hydrolase family 28-related protein n=1 Tax=Kocuria sp. CPCC 205297 TaxID=3073558 RepID=UPI0034D452D4